MPSDAISALSMQLAQEALRARGRVLPWPHLAISALSMQLAQGAVRARGRVLPWPHLAAEPVKGARIGLEEVDIEDLRRGAIEGHQMSSEAIRWQSDGNQMAIRWQSDGNQRTASGKGRL